MGKAGAVGKQAEQDYLVFSQSKPLWTRIGHSIALLSWLISMFKVMFNNNVVHVRAAEGSHCCPKGKVCLVHCLLKAMWISMEATGGIICDQKRPKQTLIA